MSENTPKVQWMPIRGWVGIYDVSSDGKIRRVLLKYARGANVLKSRKNRYGYLEVTLSHRGQRQYVRIHRAVAEAFVPRQRSEQKEVNHRDGNKMNNSADNLEWLTMKQNHAHAASLGLKASGERNGSAKLSAANVRKIRKMRGVISQKKLAAAYGVSQHAVWSAQRGKTWK